MVTGSTLKNLAGTEQNNFATSTIVSLSEVLQAGMRLEASSFDAEARKAVAVVQQHKDGFTELLGSSNSPLTSANNGFRFKRIYVEKEQGIPLISSSNIIDIDATKDKFISRKLTRKIEDITIGYLDVLISCSGTIGNIGLASRRYTGSACSQHVIRGIAKSAADAGFVAAFLRSAFGRPQLTRSVYGSVVQHIEPEHLNHVSVPNFHPIEKAEIGNRFVRSTELRDTALESLDEARRILADYLELNVQYPEIKGHNSVSLSNLRNRFDASFHSTSVSSVETEIQNQVGKFRRLDHPLHKLSVNGVTKFRKRVYVSSNGIPLLGSKQIFQIDPIDVKLLGRGIHVKDMEEIGLRHREVCVTRSGTIGKVFTVPKYMAGWAASEHVLKIVGDRPEIQSLLYTWLSSKPANSLICRLAFGSVIQEIDRWQLAEIPVPIVNNDILSEIHDCVERADCCRSEAWQLEQDAIAEIEERLMSN